MPTRLLLAEDEAVQRLDLRTTLEQLGYLVVGEVGDGASAVALARQVRPDLVIMDMRMPGMDGITAAQMLRKEHIAPVLLLTALNDEQMIERAREAGVVMYLTKPWRSGDVKPAIELTIARYRETIALGQRVQELQDQLATRRLVERAKGLLIQQHHLSEHEAYRRMNKLAMDNRKSLRAVAEAILLSLGELGEGEEE
jgi:response regulator NasT